MRLLARYDSIGYRVPGGETLWLEIDGRTVGVHSRPAYLHTDGTLEPGLLRSWIATELRYERWDGLRVYPIACRACGDTGQGHDTDVCDSCHGYGHEVNLHRCSECGKFSAEALPCAPRQTLNHELLLAHAHDACAVASTVAHVRATRAA